MTEEPKNDPQEEPEADETPAAEEAPPEDTAPEEVVAEPVSPDEEQGPTVDMPPPGTQAEHAAPGTGNMAIFGWAALCHLLGLFDLTFAPLLVGVIAPFVVWLCLKDKDPEVDHAGKEAVNFQLNMLAWQCIGFVLAICLIGIPILFVLPVLEVILVAIATIETYNGKRYRYPWIVRVLE